MGKQLPDGGEATAPNMPLHDSFELAQPTVPEANLAFKTYRQDLRNIISAACLKLEQLESHDDPKVTELAQSIHGMLMKATNQSERSGLGVALAVSVRDSLNDGIAEIVTLLGIAPDRVIIRLSTEISTLCFRQSDVVTRILFNLIQNAQIHGPETAPVTIEADLERDVLVIRIIDAGPGLPGQVVDRLFEPYNKASATQGAGLGLYSAHNMATALDGKLLLEKTGPEGTIFRLEVPVGPSPFAHGDAANRVDDPRQDH